MVRGMPTRPGRLAALAISLVAATAIAAGARPPRTRVDPRRTTTAADVSDRFVSIAVDMDQLVGGIFWDPAGGPSQVQVPPYDFSRQALRRLAAPLAPAYLRLGGSASDEVYYDVADPPLGAAPAPFVERLTRAQWDGAMAFARDLGFDVILTVNAGPGPRDATGVWLDGNARELLAYAAGRGDPVTVLEFGNEPNLFGLRAGVPGYTAPLYARDLGAFAALRDAVLPAARLGAPGNIFMRGQGEELFPGATLVAGPRTTETLPLVGSLIDIVEYHYYAAISTRCPPAGPRVDAATALDAAYLDGIDEPTAIAGGQRDAHAPGKPLWLTESGGQSCGGQLGVADRFVNSFWYLNTLGRMARTGQEVFVRQTLSGSSYGLLDDVTLAPRPDYWAALLWRRLMGTRALSFTWASRNPDVRLFAHCTRGTTDGSVTVLALNTNPTAAARLRLRRIGKSRPGGLYLVTAPDPGGSSVQLNGAVLAAAPDGTPPPLDPLPLAGAVDLPPASYAFVVVPSARAAACTAP